ncbi:MAG TPA: 23S rRNA (uracil(1939)-C(5))-methyltransferase RlmD [Thermodesulfobacteriota bacterium]|nr:23S rRNA (uracil(1939)-C(5))-methyltransferase RlmD [Thermodesulfobacteriota bacterium]
MKIEIEKLAFGGAGVGRVQGKVFFVRGGIPGDILDVRVTREKGSYGEAEIENILSPSPERATPSCPVFDRCGGCQWQHINYPYQLKAKEDIFRETLERIGGIKDVEVEPIVPSSKEYGYRSRVTLSVEFQKGRYLLGYREGRSRKLIEIEGCPIATKPIDEAIASLTRSLKSSLNKPHYPLKKIHIASDENAAYVTLASSLYHEPKKLHPLRKNLNDYSSSENIGIAREEEREFELTFSGLTFYSVPSVFIQANKEVNEQIINTLVEYAGLEGRERVLDLYCGIGNFSLHLAKIAKETIGADVSAKAIKLAKRSAELNSIKNVTFEAIPSEFLVEKSLNRKDKFDLVVLDPPREGAKEVINGIIKLRPTKIIYVSCDPPTLARDLKMLKESGYRIIKIKLFDLFPQTYHIESLALLLKI